MKFTKLLSIAAMAAVVSSTAYADAAKPDAAKPDVATLLFSTPQWGKAPVGSVITYAYSKTTSIAALGPPFNDVIKLMLDKGDAADSRSSEVQMFSGANRKPAGPFQSDEQNPVLLLAFENNVQELGKAFKASPRYLKNAIRKAWRDDAKISDVQVDVGGKMVPGTRISVTPFINLPEKDQMMGLDSLIYTVEIADAVPGNIASIDIHAPADGKPIFSETLHYQSETKP